MKKINLIFTLVTLGAATIIPLSVVSCSESYNDKPVFIANLERKPIHAVDKGFSFKYNGSALLQSKYGEIAVDKDGNKLDPSSWGGGAPEDIYANYVDKNGVFYIIDEETKEAQVVFDLIFI